MKEKQMLLSTAQIAFKAYIITVVANKVNVSYRSNDRSSIATHSFCHRLLSFVHVEMIVRVARGADRNY